MMDYDVKLNTRANIEEIGYNLDHFYWIEKLKPLRTQPKTHGKLSL